MQQRNILFKLSSIFFLLLLFVSKNLSANVTIEALPFNTTFYLLEMGNLVMDGVIALTNKISEWKL